MEFLSTVFYFIVAIFILVTVHEFGHFAAAKLFGMRVERFFIGFDFWNLKLWSIQRGETEYGIGAIPLGGYVKIAGMVDESMDTEFASKPPQPWEFRSKPTWQRLIVISAGVIMNMVLAAVIFVIISLAYGESRTPIKSGVYVEADRPSVFKEMGFRTGDLIVEVNGQPVKYWEEVLDPELFTNRTLTYTVKRGEELIKLDAPSDMMTRINDAKGEGLRPITLPIVGELVSGYPAEKIGLRKGDKILRVAGQPIVDWSDLVRIVGENANKEILVEWVTPQGEMKQANVTPNSSGKIGITVAPAEREYLKLGFFESIIAGIQQTGKMTVMTIKGFGKLLTGQEDIRKSVGGPIKIAKLAGQTAEQGAGSFLFFLAVLSISLAFLNILPIPALDGGQFVMNAVEGVMGRELPLKTKMAIQQIGFTALLILMAFIFVNDIINP
ncbi:MAG: RIP metalloprotease RseP [Chloroherpetonaceae bacterium]|nr:RIP metalloprotease RseP [Chloroherpetonaceae bacterium]MDW8019015.1 RIP metalloprotease RseP [Chloroherpetonaceae bacterium]